MIRGLLLAAGSSTRFGKQKLLTSISDGQPLVVASSKSLQETVDAISAVVNPEESIIVNLLVKEQITVISCPNSKLGIGYSISCGVAETNDAQDWVIALADMPFIKSNTIQAVVDALRKGALIAVPFYGGRRGHPVGFSRKLYSELVQLKGDVGARGLLKKYESQVVEIECEDPGIHIDIDTPEDLEKYSKEYLGSAPKNG
jgi:molybdenum cofactor cytidylyltransferase